MSFSTQNQNTHNSLPGNLRHLTWQFVVCAGIVLFVSGCGWMKQQVAGEGFQSWSGSMGKTVRNPEDKAPKHSGFFFDTKAQQIEENLGGGF